MNLLRWQKLMHAFDISSNDDTYHELFTAYSEKHRRYHTCKHIESTLKHLDSVVHLADSVGEIEIALWFHDAIYRPFSATNEFDSAIWASEFLSNNGVSQDQIDRVNSLIMATVHSAVTDLSAIAKGNDALLLVDIDLSILGVNSMAYDQFERDVRYEYKRVPYFLYKKKRKEILLSFLERDRIYQHDYFYLRLEKQARANIMNAIESL